MEHIKIGSLEWYKRELAEKDFIIQRLKKEVVWLQAECSELNKELQSSNKSFSKSNCDSNCVSCNFQGMC